MQFDNHARLQAITISDMPVLITAANPASHLKWHTVPEQPTPAAKKTPAPQTPATKTVHAPQTPPKQKTPAPQTPQQSTPTPQ